MNTETNREASDKQNITIILNKICETENFIYASKICDLKTRSELILSEKCDLPRIVSFIKGVLKDVVVSELFPLAITLKNILRVPDNIYDSQLAELPLNYGYEICDLLELKNTGKLSSEGLEFCDIALHKCKIIIAKSVRLKKFLVS
jgi:hypothetical protein